MKRGAPARTFIRTNEKIRIPEVRCVDVDGSQIGVIPTRQALTMAREKGLDLVEIAPTARPPVCRIMDFGKFRYEQSRKQKLARKHQHAASLKEVKFHANVEEHDYQTKLRHIHEFLEKGHKIKTSLFFRGRENIHQELGFQLMNRVMRDSEELGTPDMPPKKVGRSIVMILSPRQPRQDKPNAS
ncbi:MAG: translation initiation factor IF-3 [Kiritimatiellae bacterium]|nr:translation initiation factor IF-3 [Kiritimatiellia bacterium]